MALSLELPNQNWMNWIMEGSEFVVKSQELSLEPILQFVSFRCKIIDISSSVSIF